VEVRRQALVYLLFCCSGLSGLIYQVVWVRVFGNVFGNTVYSTSLVVAVFMFGLGVGTCIAGVWADRRYVDRRRSLLGAYGLTELVIGVLGFGIAALLPRLGPLSALISSYSRESNGWYVLATTGQLAAAGIAVALLTPISVLMGGTLTLLIRHLVDSDLKAGGRRVAILYGINTGGAALGCFLTDFLLVPMYGLYGTQLVAVLFNIVAAAGALFLSSSPRLETISASGNWTKRNVRPPPDAVRDPVASSGRFVVPMVGVAIGLSGFAAMGMEILWFRHISILLGGFRAVFSLLMTVILVGICAGSVASSLLLRRTTRPAQWLMAVQGAFVALALLGLAAADAGAVEQAVMANRAYHDAVGFDSTLRRTLLEFWFNARPIVLEVGLPALLMGFSFPLANAVVQRTDRLVGRRAGVLYLANTCGAVFGSLATGFLLLPVFGIQGSGTVLAVGATLAVLPLYSAARMPDAVTGLATDARGATAALTMSMLVAVVAMGLWFLLPSEYVVTHAAPPLRDERLLALHEGLTEVIGVADVTGGGRTLLTNGHPMSSTSWLSQRYMRALAHIPILAMDAPESVLVIGFGVGNTTHAATLHPSIRRVEVADLSKGILGHAGYFTDVNRDVLNDPRVAVYVNDGRHHLQMRHPASYDLITLEPPPIGYAGVAALYSREFYAMARTRLRPNGFISQWLPAYQVPAETTLAMVRAFVDVFPHAVLLSGSEADLLLVGTAGSRIEIDPERLTRALENAPLAQADLRRLDLGTAREIVGAFVASAQTLADATRNTVAASDDRPIQEYGVRSLLDFGEAVPASIVDLHGVAGWCPTCFVDGKPAPGVDGLDVYLALAARAYAASPVDVMHARNLSRREGRMIAGSAYLGAIVPESADVHNFLGITFAGRGRMDEAIAEFREALTLDPDSALTHWHLGAALAYRGRREEAIGHLRRSVQLDPKNLDARHDLDVMLKLDQGVERP
jgi:spermidine synthase